MSLRLFALIAVLLLGSAAHADTCKAPVSTKSVGVYLEVLKSSRAAGLVAVIFQYERHIQKELESHGVHGGLWAETLRQELLPLQHIKNRYFDTTNGKMLPRKEAFELDEIKFSQMLSHDFSAFEAVIAKGPKASKAVNEGLEVLRSISCAPQGSTDVQPVSSGAQ